ncbi:autotransporter-associated beta strand repeat-containing protein, partial [Pseudovibrio sp. Ad13]|uniref:autotransporter-associated beta strand repeat-containing protein n=1 Tax=Pseudovibrio sp. Ad13 TaxID=989396 RepID=UPI00187D22C8
MTTPPTTVCYKHFLNRLKCGGRMTKMAGVTASRAPYVAAAVIVSGPLVLSGATGALGQAWEGNHSTDWFTEDNWSSDIIPNSTHYVTIDTTAPNPTTVTNKTTNGTAEAQRLYVGVDGDGTLTVSDGGAVSNTHGYIGQNSGSTGTVEVTGIGSTWDNSVDLSIGHYGNGTLTVSDGGTVRSAFGYVGYQSDTTGSVEVIGTGSIWSNSNSIRIGESGDGTLSVSDGGAVSSSNGYIGGDSDITGGVEVSGTGSAWDISSGLFVGEQGDGTLTVSDGGAVNNQYGIIGGGSGSTGSVEVAGTGSTWENSINLQVGRGGDGTLTISKDAIVRASGAIQLGLFSTSSGVLNIGAGSGDTAAAAGTFDASSVEFGAGTATLVFNHTGEIGAYQFGADLSSTGFGTHSIVHESGWTDLSGNNANFTGTTVVNGGTLSISGSLGSSSGIIGSQSGSTGIVEISGIGSIWENSEDLYIGEHGEGTLTISEDATVSVSRATLLGSKSTGSGILNIGAAAGDAAVGAGVLNTATVTFGPGTGTINFNHTDTDYIFTPQIVGNGVVHQLSGTTILSTTNSGYTGGTTVSGGVLDVRNGNALANTGDVSINAGRLLITDTETVGDTALSGGSLEIGTGATLFADAFMLRDGTVTGGTLVGSSYTVENGSIGTALTGTGALTKTGTGTVRLTGTNTYTGGTTVSRGKLVVNGSIGDVTVEGGTLGGSGTIGGSVSVASGAIAAGNSPGTLTIGGDLNLTSASVLDFELGSPSGTAGADSDLIAVGGDLTLDGSLNVTDAGGFDAGVYNLIP